MTGRAAIITAAVVWSGGCALAGYPCRAQQHRGAVTDVSGSVAARAVLHHDVAYGAQGSQNDLRITWDGQHAAGRPRISVHATRVACEEFDAVHGGGAGRGPCVSVGSIGAALAPTARACAKNGTCTIEPGDLVQTALIIANGRGNPERLGNPPMFRLWIVGDERHAVAYRIAITWFYGPDC